MYGGAKYPGDSAVQKVILPAGGPHSNLKESTNSRLNAAASRCLRARMPPPLFALTNHYRLPHVEGPVAA
jgi:hypothetical protein